MGVALEQPLGHNSNVGGERVRVGGNLRQGGSSLAHSGERPVGMGASTESVGASGLGSSGGHMSMKAGLQWSFADADTGGLDLSDGGAEDGMYGMDAMQGLDAAANIAQAERQSVAYDAPQCLPRWQKGQDAIYLKISERIFRFLSNLKKLRR